MRYQHLAAGSVGHVDYPAAIAFLDRHINLEKSAAIAGRIEGLTLEPMQRLMHVLGDPQRAYPVIHVTGTNGKGSTARMIAELLAAHGLVVGLYTSPHLQRVNERLWWSGEPRQRVDGEAQVLDEYLRSGRQPLPAERDQLVPDEDLVGLDDEEVMIRLADEVARKTSENTDRDPGGIIGDDAFAALITDIAELVPLSGVEPSFFDLVTAAAFTWFAQLPADVAVVEVGVLGRYDSTNVADGQVAVITGIGQDHTDLQGDWRAAIAREKVGIVKRRTPQGPARGLATQGAVDSFLVLGETDPELRSIFEDAAGEQLWVRNEDFAAESNAMAVGGRLMDVRTPGGVLDELFLPVHGEHQGDNAALAVAAVEAFFARPLSREVAQAGLWQVRLPARFEVVDRSPLVIVDGAHNPDGAATVADTLGEDFDVQGKVVYVVGMFRGRDPVQMLDAMGARTADLVIACTPPSPRALPPEELAAVTRSLGVPAEVVSDVDEAIERARSVTTGEDVIVVTGSLYTAGAARDALGLDPL
jgi:dihydrofolate synthase/folylpolyglutamate synthase